jgi:hypothetical protein
VTALECIPTKESGVDRNPRLGTPERKSECRSRAASGRRSWMRPGRRTTPTSKAPRRRGTFPRASCLSTGAAPAKQRQQQQQQQQQQPVSPPPPDRVNPRQTPSAAQRMIKAIRRRYGRPPAASSCTVQRVMMHPAALPPPPPPLRLPPWSPRTAGWITLKTPPT